VNWWRVAWVVAVFEIMAALAVVTALSLAGCDMPEGARRCETLCSARGHGYAFHPSNGCAMQSCACVGDVDGGAR